MGAIITMEVPVDMEAPEAERTEWRWVTLPTSGGTTLLSHALNVAGKAGAVAGKLVFSLGVIGLAASAAQILTSIGVAIQSAKSEAKNRGFADGFSLGVVAGAANYKPAFVKIELFRRSTPAGYVGEEMAYTWGFNLGLVDGYRQARELTQQQKSLLFADLTARMVRKHQAAKTKLGWGENVSDVRWVAENARIFAEAHIKH